MRNVATAALLSATSPAPSPVYAADDGAGSGSDGGASERYETFYRAIERADVSTVRAALNEDAGLARMSGQFGLAPLHAAVSDYEPTIFSLLVEHGADPNALDEEEMTPLHVVQDPRAVAPLVAAGASVEARDAGDRTPLHVVLTEPDSAEVVEALLRAGADPNALDGHGATPLSLVLEHDDNAVETMLRRAGATSTGSTR